MIKPIQSAGGIVYFMDRDGKPKFLLLKRFALSKKVEWVAPKGKIKGGEDPSETALREICEEIGVTRDNLLIKQRLGDIVLSLHSEERGNLDKEISYFLVQYIGNPKNLNIEKQEGYLGQFKWANIEEVLKLVYYQNLREIFRQGFNVICKKNNLK